MSHLTNMLLFELLKSPSIFRKIAHHKTLDDSSVAVVEVAGDVYLITVKAIKPQVEVPKKQQNDFHDILDAIAPKDHEHDGEHGTKNKEPMLDWGMENKKSTALTEDVFKKMFGEGV